MKKVEKIMSAKKTSVVVMAIALAVGLSGCKHVRSANENVDSAETIVVIPNAEIIENESAETTMVTETTENIGTTENTRTTETTENVETREEVEDDGSTYDSAPPKIDSQYLEKVAMNNEEQGGVLGCANVENYGNLYGSNSYNNSYPATYENNYATSNYNEWYPYDNDNVVDSYYDEQYYNNYSSETYANSYAPLTAELGSVYGPSGKETYYNLDMSGCISNMRAIGNYDTYWVRYDGVKMLGAYVMVAADFSSRPLGSLVETSLGTGVVCDTGEFIYTDPWQIDIATNW